MLLRETVSLAGERSGEGDRPQAAMGQCCPSMSSHPQGLGTDAWLTDACALVETPATLLVLCVVVAVDLWMIQSITLEGGTQSSCDGKQRAALLQSSPDKCWLY